MKKKEKDILYPYGSLDVLSYYSQVSKVLRRFLKNKEIASKVLLLKGIPFFLVRGSKEEPLYIEDFSFVDEKMLKLRAKYGLTEAREKLSDKQILLWRYFVPRKLIHFFYACNGEKPGKPIERIFIDIDRKNYSPDNARETARFLVQEIKKDKEFNKMLKYRIFIIWTGSSFHVYLLLKKKVDLVFYNKYLSYGKKKEDSFLMKWASDVSKKLKIKVEAGHEKTKNKIILDSSNTPSGKLARCPFSLHMKNAKEVDGVAVPLSGKELGDKNLIKKLKNLTPEKVLNNLSCYKKLL